MWSQERAWILWVLQRALNTPERRGEGKKFQSKTKAAKLKIEAFNPGHRAISDKAQKNASQVKEPLLKQDMRPIDTYV